MRTTLKSGSSRRARAALAAAAFLAVALAPLAPVASAASAGSWTQTSQADFLQGTSQNADVYSSPGSVAMGVGVSTSKSQWRTDRGGDFWSQQSSPYAQSGMGSLHGGRQYANCYNCRYYDEISTAASGSESLTVYLLPAGGAHQGYYDAHMRLYLRMTDGVNAQSFLLRSIEDSGWSGWHETYGNYQSYVNLNGWNWYKFTFQVPSHFDKDALRVALHTDTFLGNYWSCSCYIQMWNYVAFESPSTATFTSNAHSAGGFARFESVSYSGYVPTGGSLALETRTSTDGATWSPWARALSGEPVPSPGGSHIQYRAVFARAASGASPRLDEVTVAYTITVDTTPPRTVGAATGASGCGGWIVSGPGVALSATDDLSGVAATRVSVGGGAFTAYGGPFAVADGVHDVEFYSVDGSGNVEPVKKITVKADTRAPDTAHTIEGAAYSGGVLYARPDALVTLAAADATSGVKVTRVDVGGGFATYGGAFALGGADSARTIRYASEDAACNAEAETIVAVIVDGTAPVTTASVLGDAGCSGWLVSPAVVALDAADAGSGVAATSFRVDGGAWTRYAGPIALADGEHVVEYRSVDRVGNAEAVKALTVRVDSVVPETVLAAEGPVHAGDRVYVAPSTEFTLAASDATSGVRATRVDTGAGAAEYAGAFTLPGDGARAIRYASEDRACNLEAEERLDVFVDGTAPTVALTAPTPLGVTAGDFRTAQHADPAPVVDRLANFGIHGSDADTLADIALLGAAEACGIAAGDGCAALALAGLAPRLGAAVVVGRMTVTAEAADPVVNGGASGLSHVAFYLDGALVAVDAEAPFEWAWDAANATAGRHELAAVAVDRLGNAAAATTPVTVVPTGFAGVLDSGDLALALAGAPAFAEALYDFVREKAQAVEPPAPPGPPGLPPLPPLPTDLVPGLGPLEFCVDDFCITPDGLPPLPDLGPLVVCVDETCVPPSEAPGVPDGPPQVPQPPQPPQPPPLPPVPAVCIDEQCIPEE